MWVCVPALFPGAAHLADNTRPDYCHQVLNALAGWKWSGQRWQLLIISVSSFRLRTPASLTAIGRKHAMYKNGIFSLDTFSMKSYFFFDTCQQCASNAEIKVVISELCYNVFSY